MAVNILSWTLCVYKYKGLVALTHHRIFNLYIVLCKLNIKWFHEGEDVHVY